MPNNAVEIVSIANTEIVRNLAITTAGTPVGTVRFYASRIPSGVVDNDYTITYPQVVSSTSYKLAVEELGVWFFWLVDDSGISHKPAAVIVKTTDGLLPLVTVPNAIAEILTDNLMVINSVVSLLFAGISIKEIVAWSSASVQRTPSIRVSAASRVNQWELAPYTFISDFEAVIRVSLVHEDGETRLPIVAQIAGAIETILNQVHYLTMNAGGICLNNCHVFRISLDEKSLGNDKMETIADCYWKGQGLDTNQ